MTKFNFNIDIEDNEKQNLLSKSKYNSISQKKLYEINQYMVDLGLPSKTIWCRYNLGVDIYKLSKPEDWYGKYYAWGELKPKNQYAWYNYKFGNKISYMKKYNEKDNLIQLQLEDDAAYQNLHIENLKFRIPFKEQFEELLENTTTKWVENYNDINGLNGRIFKSKTNNNELFIPVAGFCYNLKLINAGVVTFLWSSSLYTHYHNSAWNFYFGSEWLEIDYRNRRCGMSIRPVLLKS